MIGHPSAPGTERPAVDGARDGAGPTAVPLAAPDEPVVIPPRRRTTTSQWLTLTLVVAVIGLALGAIAAAATGAAGRGGVIAVPSGPAGAAGARQGAGAGANGGADASERAGAAQPGGAPAAPGAAGGGQSGAGRGQGRPTTGVIASIDGDTVVLTTPDGSVSIQLSDDTALQKQVPATRDDLAPGQRVLVSGERGADGAVATSGVQILGDGPAAGAGSGTGEGRAQGAAQRGGPPAR